MPEPVRWRIEPIAKTHDRAAFASGENALDEYLRCYARQNDERGLGRTFVATREGERRVLGYYTLRGGAIDLPDLPEAERRRFPRYPVPVVHLGRLAVDARARGRGLGEQLLVDALERAWRVSLELGAFAVEVIAKTTEAKTFYQRYGFQELMDDRLHLYMPMRTIAKLFAQRR